MFSYDRMCAKVKTQRRSREKKCDLGEREREQERETAEEVWGDITERASEIR